MLNQTTYAALGICAATLVSFCAAAYEAPPNTTKPVTSLKDASVGPAGSGEPLALAKQGSFFAGGTLIVGSDGDTFHGDSTFVEFDIPHNPRTYPMVMWHWGGQSSKTWESTPDGRDGYEQIFARYGYSTYVIDQARRGKAGRTTVGTTIPDAVPSESSTFNIFRLGTWVPPATPNFFPNVQFPKGIPNIDQYWFQQTPSTGPEAIDEPTRVLQATDVVNIFQKIGPGILLTHSNSGQYGWTTGILGKGLVKAIVAYEPAAFAFPSNDLPGDIPTQNASVQAITAPQVYTPAQFQNLTQMPIQIIYGDNIDFNTPSQILGVELWRVVVQRAQQFVDTVNRHGGHAEILYLPQAGLRGNTHFAFSDKNNLAVAGLLAQYLHDNGLDKRPQGE